MAGARKALPVKAPVPNRRASLSRKQAKIYLQQITAQQRLLSM
jgi:hypothetical protein